MANKVLVNQRFYFSRYGPYNVSSALEFPSAGSESHPNEDVSTNLNKLPPGRRTSNSSGYQHAPRISRERGGATARGNHLYRNTVGLGPYRYDERRRRLNKSSCRTFHRRGQRRIVSSTRCASPRPGPGPCMSHFCLAEAVRTADYSIVFPPMCSLHPADMIPSSFVQWSPIYRSSR